MNNVCNADIHLIFREAIGREEIQAFIRVQVFLCRALVAYAYIYKIILYMYTCIHVHMHMHTFIRGYKNM